MKKMKRLVALLLALVLAMGLGVTAQAETPQLTLGEETVVSLTPDVNSQIYAFQPAETGIYVITSLATGENVDPYVRLYDVYPDDVLNMDSINASDDDIGFNFSMYQEMEAGTTYYIWVSSYNSVAVSYPILVQEAQLAEAIEIQMEEDTDLLFPGDSTMFYVTFIPEGAAIEDVFWSMENTDTAKLYENGYAEFYGPGEYTITATTESGLTDSYTVTVAEPESIETLTVPGDKNILLEGDGVLAWFKFTPTESGAYKLYSETAENPEDVSGADPYIMLFDENFVLEAVADDSSDSLEFAMVCALEAGKTYYARVGHYGSYTNTSITAEKAVNPFSDIAYGAYYYLPVLWANENGITNGLGGGLFGPDGECTRAQVVTFLWRAVGEPDMSGAENPFTDLEEGSFYYDAVLWAVGNGITNGVSETSFAPDATCTRGQIATFLYRIVGEPEQPDLENPFTDLEEDAYYYDAVLWAADWGITNGMSETLFAPDDTCTRGQIVTFLYRLIVGEI